MENSDGKKKKKKLAGGECREIRMKLASSKRKKRKPSVPNRRYSEPLTLQTMVMSDAESEGDPEDEDEMHKYRNMGNSAVMPPQQRNRFASSSSSSSSGGRGGCGSGSGAGGPAEGELVLNPRMGEKPVVWTTYQGGRPGFTCDSAMVRRAESYLKKLLFSSPVRSYDSRPTTRNPSIGVVVARWLRDKYERAGRIPKIDGNKVGGKVQPKIALDKIAKRQRIAKRAHKRVLKNLYGPDFETMGSVLKTALIRGDFTGLLESDDEEEPRSFGRKKKKAREEEEEEQEDEEEEEEEEEEGEEEEGEMEVEETGDNPLG